MSRVSKDFERRVAYALGGRRAGNTGASHSDVVGTPWAVECKHSASGCVFARWLAQARAYSKLERRPYLLIVGHHRERLHAATVTLSFGEFVRLAYLAGEIKVGEIEGAVAD